MCGIIGIVSEDTVNPTLFKRLLVGAMFRGVSATGIMFYSRTENKWVFGKEGINAIEFISRVDIEKLFGQHQPRIAVGHTRTPTSGDPANKENNHPLLGGKYLLVHNGSVKGGNILEEEAERKREEEFDKKYLGRKTEIKTGIRGEKYLEESEAYSPSIEEWYHGYTFLNGKAKKEDPRIKGYKYRGECDSEIILSYLEKLGLQKGLKKTNDFAGAALAFAKVMKEKVYLWRNDKPIEIALREENGKKEIYFASTEAVIRGAITKVFWKMFMEKIELKWGHIDSLTLYGMFFNREGKIEIEEEKTKGEK